MLCLSSNREFNYREKNIASNLLKSYSVYSNLFPLQVKSENKQNKNKIRQLENEIRHLLEKIKSMEEIQGLADQQLQEADEEKETILAQLEDLEKRVRMSVGTSMHCIWCPRKRKLKKLLCFSF